MWYRCLLIFTFVYLLTIQAIAQERISGTKLIKKALEENRIEEAEKMLQQDIDLWLGKGTIDSLIAYIPLKAKISEKKSGKDAAIKGMYRFIARLAKQDITAFQSYKAWHAAAIYCESIYGLQKAYDAMNKALAFASRLHKRKLHYMAKAEYNLGVFASNMGDMVTSEKHYRKNLEISLSDTSSNPQDFYFAYNAIGGVKWYRSQFDSAAIYFTKSLDALKKMPKTSINQYYRPALVKENIAGVYRMKGKLSLALQAMYEVIDNYQTFIHTEGIDAVKKKGAIKNRCSAIDNLAGLYGGMGNYKKQGNLLQYAYQQKQQKLGEGSSGIFISEILLGNYYNTVREFNSAEEYLRKGLAHLNKADFDYIFWEADAWNTLALVYDNTQQIKEAAKAYQKSEQLYERAYGGTYDNTYIGFLRNEALFWAEHNQYKKALAISGKIGGYLKSIGEDSGSQWQLHLLNVAEISYASRQYKQAILYSDKTLEHINRNLLRSSARDSIRSEVNKPRAILIKSKSKYAIQTHKDSTFLISIYRELDSALQVLERRKALINDSESINILMAEYEELINFFSKISLELSQKGFGTSYLEKFINIREAALYSRIRSRLNKEKAIRFSNVPDSVLANESRLKQNIQEVLAQTSENGGLISNYQQALEDWNKYLAEIKKDYPRYYRMRYATLFYKLPELQHLIPENTTLIRYYMIDSSLVALVADDDHKKIIPLNATGLTKVINTILQNSADEQQQLTLLKQIYDQIWAPLENEVSNPKIMIVPDGVLYNLSFGMLPFTPIKKYRELADKSLLAKYTISYHYSLFMLEDIYRNEEINKNYVAFAPGFTDRLKNQYQQRVMDSVRLDIEYLRLLPQPASQHLVQKLQNMIGGKTFINKYSTSDAFIQNAGNHKIIHIATHAEYNNTIPEQSGLFFAKNGNGKGDNFLTLAEIYNLRMEADLMILTACETGRPGFQDGEGLVSLAHAFNYAGSKNILTALWEIDEQASAEITRYFMEYLNKGIPDDEALRQAKLDYIANNDGRVLAPAYWAGLVLMGTPETLHFNNRTNYAFWLVLSGALLIILGSIYRKRNKIKVLLKTAEIRVA